jgi:hypothetical protein
MQGQSKSLLSRLWITAIILLVVLSVLPSPRSARAQQTPPQLSPSEALQAAMDPFNQARSQNNDLTEADTIALSLGMERASRDCLALTANPQDLTKNPGQKLALGRLCLFGQQFEPARVVLVDYLMLPAPPEREAALVLLTHAFLGLKEQGSAEAQVLSLLSGYPYDAQIHLAADLVIDASEGWDSDPKQGLNWPATELCEKQRTATLPLLVQGKALPVKDGEVTASTLFADALRCVALAQSLCDAAARNTMEQLTTIVQQPNWQHTAELALMQEALARQQMVGQPSPLPVLHAHQLNATGSLLPRNLSLRRGTVVLAAFALWSPSAAERIRALALSAPPKSVYAITSWSANAGGADAASPKMLAALRTWQKTLPVAIPLLIVPDAELRAFHTDQLPAGIAIREGTVASNAVLASDGAVRMTLLAVQPPRAAR